jgi:hypothetical protein
MPFDTADSPPPAEAALRRELADSDDVLLANPPCPVDRLPRRRRNKLCIAVIALGALNFIVYTILYAVLGGDAHNGERSVVITPGGEQQVVYTVRGHFLRSLAGQASVVSRSAWLYSYLHSISVLITSGAMIISMLVLARPHIIATMRDGLIRGPAFVFALGAITTLTTAAAVALFVWDLVAELTSA